MNRFIGVGNLGDKPKLKTVQVEDEPREVVELRAYFDRLVPVGDGEFEDRGGFWLSGSLWGRRARAISELLDKGMRVRMEGTLIQENWQDKDGIERTSMKLDLDSVSLELARVAGIEMRQRETA